MNGRIILITGVMAAGKSTVAQALAERLPNSVHLRGDTFRKMIVNGRAAMGAELSDEAARQLTLRYETAAEVARRFASSGFNVVYQDMIIGRGLPEAVARFAGERLSVVVLCPRLEAVRAREAGRKKSGYSSDAELTFFDRVLREETERLGTWIDSTELSVAQTVDRIVAELRLEVLVTPRT